MIKNEKKPPGGLCRKFKRYLVFGYEQYHPQGGLDDCLKDFDDFEEAKNAAKDGSHEFGYVFDRRTGFVVYDLDEEL